MTRTAPAMLTIGRLAFVPVIVASFAVSPPVTAIALLLFIATDIYDGVLARRRGVDGPDRRALDSIVDRIAIDAGLLGAWAVGALPLPILLVLLGRDLYLTLLCRRMLVERRVVIKADWLYRSLNLAVAAWAILAPLVSAEARVYFALALLAFSLVVAWDLTRAVRIVRDAPPRLRNAVIDAGRLRASGAPALLETHSNDQPR